MCGRSLSRGGSILKNSIRKTGKRKEKIMKKKFKLQDLDCANCAAKMEDAIKKIPGVNDASVSFMMQKLTIDAEAVAACAKVEPDCKILM